MDYAQNRRRLIRLIRIYPLIALTVLSLAYLLGGFSDRENPLISQDVVITALYLFVGVVPLVFIIGFITVGKASDKAGLKNNNAHSKLNSLRVERLEIENKAKLLRPESLDKDMLDEKARNVLGVVLPNEQVFKKESLND